MKPLMLKKYRLKIYPAAWRGDTFYIQDKEIDGYFFKPLLNRKPEKELWLPWQVIENAQKVNRNPSCIFYCNQDTFDSLILMLNKEKTMYCLHLFNPYGSPGGCLGNECLI